MYKTFFHRPEPELWGNQSHAAASGRPSGRDVRAASYNHWIETRKLQIRAREILKHARPRSGKAPAIRPGGTAPNGAVAKTATPRSMARELPPADRTATTAPTGRSSSRPESPDASDHPRAHPLLRGRGRGQGEPGRSETPRCIAGLVLHLDRDRRALPGRLPHRCHADPDIDATAVPHHLPL